MENWDEQYGEDGDWIEEVSKSRIVREDVTDIPDEKLCEMLDEVHCELIPEDSKDARAIEQRISLRKRAHAPDAQPLRAVF